MNYDGAKELAESFRTVRKNTITIAEELPEDQYGFRPAPNTRTVGELLTHISVAYTFQYEIHGEKHRTSLEGFDFPSLMQRLMAEERVPRSKDQILEMLRSSGAKWTGWIEGLPESLLGERVQMSAGMITASKSRFEMVLSVKEHEMHHRGQLMLIERMVVPVPHLTREMQARMAAAPLNMVKSRRSDAAPAFFRGDRRSARKSARVRTRPYPHRRRIADCWTPSSIVGRAPQVTDYRPATAIHLD